METTLEPQQKQIAIFIVDDHPLIQFGLAELFAQEEDMFVCGSASDVDDALAGITETSPDLVIVDISLKNSNGIDLIKRLKSRRPSYPVLVSSMHTPTMYAERALKAGATAYVQKHCSVSDLLRAVRDTLRGKTTVIPEPGHIVRTGASGGLVQKLSDRELQVFELLGQGRSSREVAEDLHLSIKTIETHREHIKKKLQLRNSSELVRQAVEWVIESRQ